MGSEGPEVGDDIDSRVDPRKTAGVSPARLGDVTSDASAFPKAGGRITWRLEVPTGWAAGLDPAWLPRSSGESWRRVFDQEDISGRVFLDPAVRALPWKDLATAATQMAFSPFFYRVQLRASEEAARCCEWTDEHLAALASAVPDEVPTRTEPPGAWRARALVDGRPVTLAEHPSADRAEGEAAARRCGDAELACWAEPTGVPAGDEGEHRRPHDVGWRPSQLPPRRLQAFAVEDAARSLLAAASQQHLGPDVLTAKMVATLGAAAWVMARQYRAELAALWSELERCPAADAHEGAAEMTMAQLTGMPDGPGPGRWRHVALAALDGRGPTPIELSDHDGIAAAAASVAAARAVDNDTVRWAEPVLAGPRPFVVTA